jgi:hypothetical protein
MPFFVTPTWRERMWGNRLFQRMHLNVGHTIARFGTSYQQIDVPSSEQMETADALYVGGRIYEIDIDEETRLRVAGYGRWVVQNIDDAVPDVDISAYGTGPYGSGPYGD